MISQKLAIIFVILVILISVIYFFSLGEEIKKSFEMENLNAEPTVLDPEGDKYSSIPAFAMEIIYLTEQSRRSDKNSPLVTEEIKFDLNNCLVHFENCVDLVDLNSSGKDICRGAITSSKLLAKKVRSENSVVVGFNQFFFGLGNMGFFDNYSKVINCLSEIEKIKSKYPSEEGQ